MKNIGTTFCCKTICEILRYISISYEIYPNNDWKTYIIKIKASERNIPITVLS